MKFLSKKGLLLTLLVILTLIVPAASASAAGVAAIAASALSAPSMSETITNIVAYVANLVLNATSMIVFAAGAMLNVSIIITLHIKDFVNNTPAIYDIWRIIRDISGIFFIFFLLFAAIQMILSRKNHKFGDTIVNIVIAGILINFSFFIVSVAIDGSNVVSQAIYNSMIPAHQSIKIEKSASLGDITKMVTSDSKGGISDIFMYNLKIPSLYDMSNKGGGKDLTPLKVIIIAVIGVMIMITTAISFVLASLAFIIRLVLLLFILAFSPIWFAAMVIPQLKEWSGKIMKQLSAQLLFMPVYLLLMYVALYILNSSDLFSVATMSPTNFTGSVASNWMFGYAVLFINFAMVIIMLNLPLIIGLTMGGWATDKLGVNKWGAGALWSKFGKSVGNQAGSRTVGRAAYALNNSESMNKFMTNNPVAGRFVSGRLGKLGNSGFGTTKGGYEERLKSERKAIEDMYKKIGTVERGDFAPGPEGDKEFGDAKNRAEQRQQNYRATLKNQSRRGIIYTMMDHRGSSQSYHKLEEQAEKAAKKKAKKEAEKVKKDLLSKNKDLKEKIDKLNPILAATEIGDLKDQIKKNEDALSRAEDDILAGANVEREEKDKKIED